MIQQISCIESSYHGTGNVWLVGGDVSCPLNAFSIRDCNYRSWGSNSSHSNDLWLYCLNRDLADTPLGSRKSLL